VHRVAAKRAEIAARYKAKRRDRPVSMAALRIADLRRLFQARYGNELPDDDAGRDDVLLMAHHLARRIGDPARRIAAWLASAAPWISKTERADLIAAVLGKPLRWRADKLAQRLSLTDAERRRLRITTIGAIDKTKAERQLERKDRKREAARARRRAGGAWPRTAYEASSVARMQPWLAMGISRRTWYRGRQQLGTSSGPV
jgi:hypothetical protein